MKLRQDFLATDESFEPSQPVVASMRTVTTMSLLDVSDRLLEQRLFSGPGGNLLALLGPVLAVGSSSLVMLHCSAEDRDPESSCSLSWSSGRLPSRRPR